LKPVPPKAWPPIIEDVHLPRLIVWRDRLLTTGMWLLLIWFCRHPLLALVDFLRPPFGQITRIEVPSLLSRWERIRPYVAMVALIVGWLSFWGLVTLARYRRVRRMPHPPGLALEDQARKAGCTPEELTQWRTFRVSIVHLDEQGALNVVAKDPSGS